MTFLVGLPALSLAACMWGPRNMPVSCQMAHFDTCSGTQMTGLHLTKEGHSLN